MSYLRENIEAILLGWFQFIILGSLLIEKKLHFVEVDACFFGRNSRMYWFQLYGRNTLLCT